MSLKYKIPQELFDAYIKAVSDMPKAFSVDRCEEYDINRTEKHKDIITDFSKWLSKQLDKILGLES